MKPSRGKGGILHTVMILHESGRAPVLHTFTTAMVFAFLPTSLPILGSPSRAARQPLVLSQAPLNFLSPHLVFCWAWSGQAGRQVFNYVVTYLHL